MKTDIEISIIEININNNNNKDTKISVSLNYSEVSLVVDKSVLFSEASPILLLEGRTRSVTCSGVVKHKAFVW